jgi:PTS system mannose-specific IID component
MWWALIPSLNKFYGHDKELLKNAHLRYQTFFNTAAVHGGGPILGILLSLEETRAKELEETGEEVGATAELIESTKVGLMGPLAGIGDSIDSAVVQYLFIAIFLPLAIEGNWLGALLPWVFFTIATYTYGYYYVKMGYTMGRNAAAELLGGSAVGRIIELLSIVGMFMMGIIGANYVNVTSTLSFELSGRVFDLQSTLDGILPGILPFILIMGIYYYYSKKGLNITKALIWTSILLGVLAVIGIL